MPVSKRWRGQMPFRQNRRLWPEPLEQQGRGGESSLAHFRRTLDFLREYTTSSQGKGPGSFTEGIREALKDWLKARGMDWYSQISFEYRLSRHKRITVNMTHPRIYHRPQRGDGSKGFVLDGIVLSIDGLLPPHRTYYGEFALNRIVGHHPVRLLTMGEMIRGT
jgi:hypothetical protein